MPCKKHGFVFCNPTRANLPEEPYWFDSPHLHKIKRLSLSGKMAQAEKVHRERKDAVNKLSLFILVCLLLSSVVLSAQGNAPPPPSAQPSERQSGQQAEQTGTPSRNEPVTVFRVKVSARTTKAVNYRH